MVKLKKNNKEMSQPNINGAISVEISSVRTEYPYIIDSNIEKCKHFLYLQNWRYGDTIDFLISLHLVLEAGLNGLFRELSLMSLKKGVPMIDVVNNIDNISYIDKTILFIYNSSFDFANEISKAGSYHKIIGQIREFSEPRNKILHGHSVGTFSQDDKSNDTYLRKAIVDSKLIKKQITLYRSISEGISFYLNHLSLNKSIINNHSAKFLDYSFLSKFDELDIK